jgi:cytidyltransferase-like protein
VIVATEELETLRGRVTMVDGSFDPIHEGHIAYVKAAAELGPPVLVNVTGDHYVGRKHPVLLADRQRAQVLDAIEGVAYVHVSQGTTADVLTALAPKIFAKGADWDGRLPDDEIEICREAGIELVFLDTVRNSSTRLLRDVLARQVDDDLAGLERYVAAQQANPASRFDEEYFVDQWRDDASAYTVEARRPIEGRNPELIRDVLAPRTLLDAGCGPGTLMYLLWELGVVADGLDASPSVVELAPPEVAGRIATGSVGSMPFEDRAYDVVICREVLEHLTVPEVSRAVAEICRVTDRLAYVTTRFHPSPASLFDVTTELDVDPTHITCLNQDLLRAMFVLNGFRRRADLERSLDWLDKRRVLVYERNEG